MFEISKVKGRQIIDSRGNPTVEAEVFTDERSARASVPSGKSTGKYEAVELRDGDKEFGGKGVKKAIKNINEEISPLVEEMDVREQFEIDRAMIELDGTENKSRLGANAILAVSMAIARVSSRCSNLPLYKYIGKLIKKKEKEYAIPIPFMNIINGGKHAGNKLDIQEYMIAPIRARNFCEAMRECCEIYHSLEGLLKSRYGLGAINVGDEGGFAPPLSKPNEPLDFIQSTIDECGYEVKIAIDPAASEFNKNGKYIIGKKALSTEEMVDFYEDLVNRYQIISIEDPFAEDDWEGFSLLTQEIGNEIQIVGDDLFATNIHRLKKGFERNACNCLLLKLNQIGTLSEGIEVAKEAFENSYGVMVSHRSGETCDSFIADLAVGINAGQIKAGAPCRGERTAKYNRLLRIEEDLESDGIYGKFIFKNSPARIRTWVGRSRASHD